MKNVLRVLTQIILKILMILIYANNTNNSGNQQAKLLGIYLWISTAPYLKPPESGVFNSRRIVPLFSFPRVGHCRRNAFIPVHLSFLPRPDYYRRRSLKTCCAVLICEIIEHECCSNSR